MPNADFFKKFRAGFKGTKPEDEQNEMGKEFQEEVRKESDDGKKKIEKSLFNKIKSRFSSN